MTHATLDELLAVRDGEGAPETAEHLKGCAVCEAHLEDLRRLRDRLRELPGAEPPADGWNALAGRLREQHRSRCLARSGWAAAAAMVLFTGAVAVRGGIEAWAEVKHGREVRALIEQSQELEAQVRSSDTAGMVMSGNFAYAVADLQHRLEGLDSELAAAKRDRRPAAELAELWRQRVDLLEDLLSARNARVVYVGI